MRDPVTAFVVYILLWWLSFFVMLPIGVRQSASEDLPSGAEAGAPAAPKIGQKMLWASGLAALLWGVAFAVISTNALNFIAFF